MQLWRSRRRFSLLQAPGPDLAQLRRDVVASIVGIDVREGSLAHDDQARIACELFLPQLALPLEFCELRLFREDFIFTRLY